MEEGDPLRKEREGKWVFSEQSIGSVTNNPEGLF